MDMDSEQCPWCGSQIERGKFDEIETRIRNEEQQRLREAEQKLQERFASEKMNLEKRFQTEANEKNAILTRENLAYQETIKGLEASKSEAIKQAQIEATNKAKEEFDRNIQLQRLTLERDSAQKVNKLQESFFQEREAFQRKIAELSNQLQKKNEQEPEITTINICEELKLIYEDDEISELNEKVIHKVLYKGIDCGVIIIDVKPRQSWQRTFAANLRKEQLNFIAEHAIIATTVFPKGKKELCIEDGIIIAHPNCVVHLIDLFRKSMIKMVQQGLSAADRTTKVSRLYDFISSESYNQKRQEVSSLTQDILDLDVVEMEQHKKTWKKRGVIAMQLQKTLSNVDSEINEILEENFRNKTKTPNLSTVREQPLFRKVQ